MRNSSVDQIILDLLAKENAHLNSHEIFAEIKPLLPAVNQSTVYRALDRLVQNGRLSVSDMGTGAAVYELVENGIHHHLVCQKCGQVITISDDEVQRFFTGIQQEHRFEVKTNHLILFGVCENCRQ